ncbi:unnamed protein product [Adineta steineri]|uniref:G-protein coupled receptors family 1 profile domain-containing protein n=1 Tax=Adineta steineri TaxID=433720 RepID=A0A814MKM6_9BILA|nr:unnamed protein product [Adineta steineri]
MNRFLCDPHDLMLNNMTAFKFSQKLSNISIYVLPILALVGNSLTLLVVFNNIQLNHSSFSVYIKSMAISDTLVLLFKFISYQNKESKYYFSSMCTILIFCGEASVLLSIWTIVAITIERTLVVLFPLHIKKFVSVYRARVLTTIIAILTIIVSARLLIIPIDTSVKQTKRCHPQLNWHSYRQLNMTITQFGYIYIPLPIVIIGNLLTICTVKKAVIQRHDLLTHGNRSTQSNENQLMLMLLMVTLMFIVYFVPFTLTNIISRWGLPFNICFTTKAFEIYIILRALCEFLKDLNFCTNFIIYCISGRRFRHAFYSLHKCNTQQSINTSQYSETNKDRIVCNNTFHGQATYSVGTKPLAVAIADVNSDNKPDIVVANYGSGTVSIPLNAGNGTFNTQTTYPVGTNPYSVAVVDVNNDNKPDIIVTNFGSSSVGVLLNAGSGTFSPPTNYTVGGNPLSVVVVDVNSDTLPDIIVVNLASGTVSILLNAGNGTFSAQTKYPVGIEPRSVAVVDVNNDNKPDIIVGNSGSNAVGVLLNAGNGTFNAQTTYLVGTNPYSVAVVDVNSDNKLDIIVANEGSNTVGVLLSTGSGTFNAPTNYSVGTNPYSVAVVDVNSDNKPDIVVANYGSSNVGFLLNAGMGTFNTQTTYTVGTNPWSVAVFDVNSDNKPDIIVANFVSSTVSVLLHC